MIPVPGSETNDRVVGPWAEVMPGRWLRCGPPGFTNLEGTDIVAWASLLPSKVPSGNFGCYSPDGQSEDSGHAWGDISPDDVPKMIDFMKDAVDDDLRSFGWVVDGVGPRAAWWSRLWTACLDAVRTMLGSASTT